MKNPMKKCIEPNKIESWKLDAYIDGLVLPGVQEHLQKCAACSQKLDEIRRENELYSRALFRLQCPDTDQILNYVWDLLDEETSLRTAVHITKCPHCLAESERLAPAPVIEETGSESSLLPELGRRLRLFMAQLQPYQHVVPVRFDDQAQSITRGQASFTKVYTIEELDLTILLDQWIEDDKTCTIQGQLLGMDSDHIESFQVSLMTDERRVATQKLNAVGVFSFTSIRCNQYTLCFHTPRVQLCVPDIDFS